MLGLHLVSNGRCVEKEKTKNISSSPGLDPDPTPAHKEPGKGLGTVVLPRALARLGPGLHM